MAPNKFDLAGRDRAERERWLELAKRTIELPELLNWSEHAMYIGKSREAIPPVRQNRPPGDT